MTKKHSWILSAMLVSSFWSGAVMAAPAANPAGAGPGVAIGTGSSAARDTSVAVGKNATTMDSNGAANGGGDVAIGSNAKVNNYVNQGGSIAMGENSFAENMAGRQESLFNFNQTTFTGSGFLGLQSPFIPADPSKVTGSIALGQNSYARSGGTVIGVHNYKGALGDMTIDTSTEANRRSYGINVNATTIGTNSFNNAAFGVVNGAYSIISGAYNGSSYSSKAGQNFGATITGSLNSIESKTADSDYSGVANSIVGTANRTFNSNGSLIFGAGNEITNSVTTIAAPSGGGNSAKELAETLRGIIRDADGGGATLAVGGGNKADYTRASQLIGVNNTLTGTAGSVSDYNMINGYKNTASQVSHVSVTGSENTVSNTKDAVVMGNKRDLSGASGSIVLGSADSTMTTGVTDAVSIGHNANVTEAGGVALGAQSKASTAAGAAGYDPSSRALSQDTSSTWKATAAAVSVGDGTTVTRQITSVAAGTNDTDAVNVAQLKQAVLSAGTGTDTRNTVVAGDHVAVDEAPNADGSSTYTVSVKADGKVESGNTGIVTGSTVYNEVRPAADGTYVKTDSTTGQNLTALDNQVRSNADAINTNAGNIAVNQQDISNLKDLSNITAAGTTVIKNAAKEAIDVQGTDLATVTSTVDDQSGKKTYTVSVKADGKVESGNTGIVTGSTVYNEVRPAADGTYVKTGSTTGQNLTALDNQVRSNADSISHMSGSIDRLGTRVNRVGAGAAALAALHPLDFDPDSKWDFAAGYGNYKDAHAVAAGVYYRPNEDTMFSVGGSFGGGENMVNAGLSLKLGQGNHVSTSRVAMAKEIKDLRSDVENLRSAIASMAAGNALDPGKTKLFPDIPENHWAYDEIAQLYGNGIVKGYPDGRFDGDRMMTRYEFASLVYEQMQKGAALSNRVVTEFMPELERIRVDTVAKTRDGRPAIQRVRVIKDRG